MSKLLVSVEKVSPDSIIVTRMESKLKSFVVFSTTHSKAKSDFRKLYFYKGKFNPDRDFYTGGFGSNDFTVQFPDGSTGFLEIVSLRQTNPFEAMYIFHHVLQHATPEQAQRLIEFFEPHVPGLL